ncbi:MAG: hypothetical protein BA863_01605 [Desulfovibrio sp. S3730MH75]|nr:MAG: hypothetical protein BA863_01605 [Desulfovibrio sp. S3730MH75]
MSDTRCINYIKLAEILGRAALTVRNEWRIYPHYFVGIGRTLKSARFDLDEVLEYLKEQTRDVIQPVQRPRGEIPLQVQVPGKAVHKDRPNKKGRSGLESSKGETNKSDSKGPARGFNVFRNVSDLSGGLPSSNATANG